MGLFSCRTNRSSEQQVIQQMTVNYKEADHRLHSQSSVLGVEELEVCPSTQEDLTQAVLTPDTLRQWLVDYITQPPSWFSVSVPDKPRPRPPTHLSPPSLECSVIR